MKKIMNLKRVTAIALAFFTGLGCGAFFLTGGNAGVSAIQETSASKGEGVILVIDPGHGGMDGGASSAAGVEEKDINLAIGMNLKKIAEEYGVTVIMTRESDCGLYTDDDRTIRQKKREDLLNRKKIMEESEADLAVSIHLNSFPSNAAVHGAQIFYPSKEQKSQEPLNGEQTGEQTSKIYAEAVQKSIEESIPDGKERVAMSKNDILLFQEPPCKIILAECGFLSNAEEASLLQTAEYQQKISGAIWGGINEIFGLKKPLKIEIVESANKAKK